MKEVFNNYTIKKHKSGRISITYTTQVPNCKEVLRQIAKHINVSIYHDVGTKKNTRLLGAHVIKRLKELK